MKLLCVLLMTAAAWAADDGMLVGIPGWNGVSLRLATRLESSGIAVSTKFPGSVVMEPGRIHRHISDPVNKREFAYDLSMESSGDGVQIRVEPPRYSENLKYTPRAGWTQLTLPKSPVIPNLKIGDTAAVDLLVNPATGQKVVEYLTVVRSGAVSSGAPARDFGLDDISLKVQNPRLWVNGKLEDVTANLSEGTSGAVVWFYLRGHGRFSMSLVPREHKGYRKNGVVADNAVIFRVGSAEYRLLSAGPIAPAAGAFNLYLRHEPEWYWPEIFGLGSQDADAETSVTRR